VVCEDMWASPYISFGGSFNAPACLPAVCRLSRLHIRLVLCHPFLHRFEGREFPGVLLHVQGVGAHLGENVPGHVAWAHLPHCIGADMLVGGLHRRKQTRDLCRIGRMGASSLDTREFPLHVGPRGRRDAKPLARRRPAP